jgi:hypothetical protein
MIVACRVVNGLNLGFVQLQGPSSRPRIPGSGEDFDAGKEIKWGFVINRNVDSKKFRAWLLTNEDSPMVVNGLVFGSEDENLITMHCYTKRGRMGNEGGAPQGGMRV